MSLFWCGFCVTVNFEHSCVFRLGIAAVSFCRKDRLTSNSSLFCKAACVDACSKIFPGVFLGVRGIFRDSSSLNLLVVFLGLALFPRWLLSLLISHSHFPELVFSPVGFFLFRWFFFAAIFCCLVSSKRNLLIFSWFLLYSPTFLHKTKCISPGFYSAMTGSFNGYFSVVIGKSFFLITVFFLIGVSVVIVWAEYPVIEQSSIMFHCGANVRRGSFFSC